MIDTKNLVKDGRFTGSYWQWLKVELSGWDSIPWILFGLGTGFQLALLLTGPINWLTIVTFIGVFFGQWCTVAMGAGGYRLENGRRIRVSSHAINGLLGSISVIAYIIVNAQSGHWWSILDQLVFFFAIDLELLLNWRTWGQGSQNTIKKLTKKGTAIAGVVILIAWGILYFVGLALHDTNPVWDALSLAIGATASWLCYRRYSFTYSLWLISDIINIILWATTLKQGVSAASIQMLVMQLFYLATSIMGKINWRPSKEIN